MTPTDCGNEYSNIGIHAHPIAWRLSGIYSSPTRPASADVSSQPLLVVTVRSHMAYLTHGFSAPIKQNGTNKLPVATGQSFKQYFVIAGLGTNLDA